MCAEESLWNKREHKRDGTAVERGAGGFTSWVRSCVAAVPADSVTGR